MYKVFLADDEPWAILGLKELVNWEDYNLSICGTAEDGEQALSMITELKPDIIITDIRMPGMSGIELIEELRLMESNAQVIFESGYTDFEYAQKAIKLGCIGYIVKPVEKNELLEYLDVAKNKIGKNSVNEVSDNVDIQEGVIKEIISYINENYYEPITLQLLADKFSLNDTYISAQIKKKTGNNFGEHLVKARISKAKELLINSNLSIEEIAVHVGYQDYYYFNKVFKKAVGITPSAFRKSTK